MVLESVTPVRIGVGPGKQTCNAVASSLWNFARQNVEQVAGSLHAVYVILDAHVIPGKVNEDRGHACENYCKHDYSFGTAMHMRLTPNVRDEARRVEAGQSATDAESRRRLQHAG